MARGDRQLADNGEVSITLSPHQVEHIVRAAGSEPGGLTQSLLLAALDHAHRPDGDGRHPHASLRTAARQALDAALEDPQLSQSLLRGLAILSCYSPEREWRTITDLARELDMPPSTTHRYTRTLQAVGLLEQHPQTRWYRPASVGR